MFIYLDYLSSFFYRFKIVTSVFVSITAHDTQKFLVCFTEELQLLVVFGAKQGVTQGLRCLCGWGFHLLLCCKMLSHDTHHVSQKSAGTQISLSVRSATLGAEVWVQAAVHVSGDALATKRVLAGQHHWIGEITQTYWTLDLPGQWRIHFKRITSVSLKRKILSRSSHLWFSFHVLAIVPGTKRCQTSSVAPRDVDGIFS